MNLQEALKLGRKKLAIEDIEAPAAEAGVILCHVIKKEKVYLYSHGEDTLVQEQLDLYFKLLEQRVKGKPLQYITGYQEFMSLDFIVDPAVLIPRQDTEILVETVLDYINNMHGTENPSILDIGTGSGCIAVSLAHYAPNVEVYALDISEAALEKAHLNAIKNNVETKVQFINADIFQIIKGNNSEKRLNAPFDIVVSNPPYIPAEVIKTLKTEVRDFEPCGALNGGDDGLDYYKAIKTGISSLLKPEGLLALEIGYDQAQEVKELFKDTCSNIKIINDLSGNNRVFYGILK